MGATSLQNYGVFNTPHQFTSESDPRDSSNWKGRAYSTHILENSPLVMFKIGRPDYAAGGDNDSSVLQDIMTLDDDEKADYLDTLFNGKENEMYYYTFKDDFDNYSKYVNAMVRYTAVKMNLSNYSKFNLYEEHVLTGNDNWFKTFFESSLNLTNYLAFYCNSSGTSTSESGSNSTGESQLAGGIKSLGQTKREIDFLFGTATNVDSSGATSYQTYANKLTSLYGATMNGVDKVLNKMSGTFTSVASGANVLFPEVWQDSSYRASYSVEIRLMSPYGDKESIFKNIYIPFFCLLAMAMPRQSGKQGYTSPFIIQCWSKGWFSCNCGMVESIDIKKGGSSGQDWSVDNLPTELTVTLNIKDLYPTMIASGISTKSFGFGNNIGLTDYLKVMSGIEMTDFDPISNIEEVLNTITSSISDIPTRIYQTASNIVGMPAQKIISKVFGGNN